MSEETLGSLRQLGDGVTTDAYQPGDDKQRVDLDEFYETTEQGRVKEMVTGTEMLLKTGTLSKAAARLAGLEGCENYDPIPSKHNARMGAESFLTTIVDGFRKFIENIIKYIRMAVNWVIDLVKTLTGYKKTERQVKQAEEEAAKVKTEFENIFKGLGFPTAQWDLDKVIGDIPLSFDRLGAFTIMKNKLGTDAEAIKRLGESLPSFYQAIEYMNDSSKKVKRARENLSKVIHVAARNLKNGTTDGNAELQSVIEAGHEIKLAINFGGISDKLSELLSKVYFYEENKKIKENSFDNAELQARFMEIKAALIANTQASRVNMVNSNTGDKSELILKINEAAMKYTAFKENPMPLDHLDFSGYKDLINQSDSVIIHELANITGVGNALVSSYQATAVLVRDYMNFCHQILTMLNQIQKQLESIWAWHLRAQQIIKFYVLKDLETLIELNKQLRNAGFNPHADLDGKPFVDAFIKYDDRVTLFEKIAGTTNDLLEVNINGVKSAIKTLGRQLGWNAE